MIKQLQINNYAIIDQLNVQFEKGLNIITGETGAGKSILLGALGLILGSRADTSVLSTTEKKCIVECSFEVKSNKNVEVFLTNNDLDNEGDLIIRREISSSGKSRAFVNDTPVNLQQLKELALLLVDLHQQFDTLQLGDSDFQRKIIDAIAANDPILINYQIVYKNFHAAITRLRKLEQQKDQFDKELSFHQFQYEELQSLHFLPNELEDLEAENKLLSNSEEIKLALSQSSFSLTEGETPIVSTIKQLANKLSNYEQMHPQLAELASRLSSLHIELKDIDNEIQSLSQSLEIDEKRILEINERMAAGYRLLKKHNVKTTEELLLIQTDLERKLTVSLQTDEQIDLLRKEVDLLHLNAKDLANKLSETRLKQINVIQSRVNEKLAQVGMPNARLKVQIQKTDQLGLMGQDQIEFLFDGNKSEKYESVRKVASGGELSRLMLCIKSLVAQSIELPTLIFDEIDTGISGQAAKQVGLIMQSLSNSLQVISITHQPQIAAKASTHFYVYKDQLENVIKTNIRVLSKQQRIETIAKMLGGEHPTAAALQSAKEMMEN